MDKYERAKEARGTYQPHETSPSSPPSISDVPDPPLCSSVVNVLVCPTDNQNQPQPSKTHEGTHLVLLITFSNILGPTDFACRCVLTISLAGAGVLGGAESG